MLVYWQLSPTKNEYQILIHLLQNAFHGGVRNDTFLHAELQTRREHNHPGSRLDPLSGKTRIGENYKCLRMVNPLPDPSRRRDSLGRGGPTRERGQ
jgi:hypothetical protein